MNGKQASCGSEWEWLLFLWKGLKTIADVEAVMKSNRCNNQ